MVTNLTLPTEHNEGLCENGPEKSCSGTKLQSYKYKHVLQCQRTYNRTECA
jgi:hypothetical protein